MMTKATAVLTFLETKFSAVALLAARLVLGVIFFDSGKGKLEHLDGVIEYFTSLGIPAPQLQAPFVASLELVGGVMLLVGLGARLFSVPLSFTMLVAIATAKWADVEGLHGLLALEELHYLVLFVVVVAFGPGPLSVDAVLRRRLASPHSVTQVVPAR